MPDKDQGQRGMACGVEIHEPVADEFRQEVCEHRRFRRISSLELSRMGVEFESKPDRWNEQFLS